MSAAGNSNFLGILQILFGKARLKGLYFKALATKWDITKAAFLPKVSLSSYLNQKLLSFVVVQSHLTSEVEMSNFIK